jgi:flagellar hook-associated protein 2
MTMALSTGLISGMDTGTLISQLVAAEAAPQTALRARLSATNLAASAYRTVNTTFAAVRAAAEAMTTNAVTSGRKALSDHTGVAVSTTAAAQPGTTLNFTPLKLAATHTSLSNSEWTTTTGSVRDKDPAWPLEIRKADGTTVVGTVDVAAGGSLSDAVTAINEADLGVRATIVTLGTNRHRLQLTSTTPGLGGGFVVKSATETDATVGAAFTTTREGQDATLDLGTGVLATSTTNTFAELIPGVSLTISRADGVAATVTVDSDQEAVATKMQTLVDAVNSALSNVKTYTSNAPGSTAALKGDYAVTSLAGRLLDAVSGAVGTFGSPAKLGIQLTRDGKVTFDKAAFMTAVKDDPAVAQALIAGAPASNGPDGVVGGVDDVPAATGVAARLLDVAKAASDTATGSLGSMAKGQESRAKDIQNRIEAWDLRLAKRREMLTRQFTGMETALSALRNQSTWLAGQINSLPTS